jgi:hypothetical protein
MGKAGAGSQRLKIQYQSGGLPEEKQALRWSGTEAVVLLEENLFLDWGWGKGIWNGGLRWKIWEWSSTKRETRSSKDMRLEISWKRNRLQ